MLLPLLAGLLLPVSACGQQPAGTPEGALLQGRYDVAIEQWSDALEDDPSNTAIRRSLATALIEVGRYEDAVEAAGDLHNVRGEALRATGQTAEAERAFQASIDAGDADRWMAELNLAELVYNRGEVDVAMDRFDRFIDLYNQSSALTPVELTAVGSAVWYLGIEEPELFQDAVLAFDQATKTDPTYIEPHIRLGELFVEKYNSPEAHTALGDALRLNPRHPRALLAMARVQAFDGNRAEALELVRQALEVNPNLVPARVFLARMYLDVEDGATAEDELKRALEINPTSLEALSMLAAVHFVNDRRDQYEELKGRIEQMNPRYEGLLTTVAEIAAQQRRYGEAAQLAQEATRINPQSWNAFGVLGLNQFRLGRIQEATASLEQAFAGDPYNVWIKNNLDLLDTFEEYEVVSVPGFEFMLHRNEAELLRPYLEVAAAEAHASLTARYRDEPRGRVRIELYPRSADFSVRTVGLAGLGALGVSFGDVLALDAPSAREAGSYNWLTTFWHEMAHTIALGVSNNRVPRWFTEGLSTYEERQARPSWGTRITPELLIFYDDGELPPVSRLNEGFMRPKSPRHLSGAYDLASLVIEWIVETRGSDTIVRMLNAYGAGMSDERIVEEVLDTDAERLDAEFDRWLRQKSDPARARQFMQLFQEGRSRLEAGNLEQAQRALEAAGQLFPVAASGSPYGLLAQMHLRNGDTDAAREALVQLTEYDETAYLPNLELAELLEADGDEAGAAKALERAVWIYPYEPAPHLKLAELYAEQGDWPRAVRERRALVALAPTDRASALYQLALALLSAGDREGARTEVLRALEAAPAYEEAQALLLRIHEES